MTEDFAGHLDAAVEGIRQRLQKKNEARERAIPLCRETIRCSATAIRAMHRGEFERGRELTERAHKTISEAAAVLADEPDIYWAGFIHDAQKEFAEASALLELVTENRVPSPESIGVEPAAYLNGLAEAAGELRRHLLDRLRLGDVAYCERCLGWMDEIYGQLVTIDYPDAMTGGLRRNTDMVRGVLEKSRGDLTAAARQRALEQRLDALERNIGSSA